MRATTATCLKINAEVESTQNQINKLDDEIKNNKT